MADERIPPETLTAGIEAANAALKAQRRLLQDNYQVMDAARVLLSAKTKELVRQVQLGSSQVSAAREELRLKEPMLDASARMASLKLQELRSAKTALDFAKMSGSVTSAALTDMQSTLDDAQESYDIHRLTVTQLSNQIRASREIVKLYKTSNMELAKNAIYHVVEGADSLVEVFRTLTQGPLMLFVQLLKLAFDRFSELDKAAESFRKTTGLTINQTRELRKNAEAVNVKYRDMGVGIEQANKATTSLVDSFGGMAIAGSESVTTTALLAENLGVAADNVADVLVKFQGLGGLSEKVANNMIKAGMSMTKNTPISFAKVMEDIAKSSDEVHYLLGNNPQLLMKTAIQARALGASINAIASTSKKLLDFSSSINSEMEATALLGVTVNLQRARQLAFDGKIVESAQEVLRVVKRTGDWNKMNVFQREALAKASGMELKDLNKMVALDRIRNSGTADGAKLKALDAQLAAMNNINMSEEAKLVMDAEEEIKQRQIQGVMTNLGNMLKSIFLELANVLTPVVKVLVTMIVPALKVVGLIVKSIGVLLSPIGDLFEWIDSHVGSTEGMLNKVSGWLDNIRDAAGVWAMFAKSIAAAALLYLTYTNSAYIKKAAIYAIDKLSSKLPIPGLSNLMGRGAKAAGGGLAGKAASGIGSMTKSASSGIESMSTAVGSGITKVLKGVSSGIGALAKAVGGGISSVLKGISAGIRSLSSAVGSGISKILKGISKGVESFGSPKFFKGVLGIALLGASIIPLAFALKMFTGIDWASVALGGVSLAVLAGFAAVIGNFAGQIIPGAIAMTLLGISIIPLAFALNMFGTVDWASVMLGGVALVGLAVVAAVLGSFVPLILLGALAIAALGVALIPFAAAAYIAGLASQELGKGIGMMCTPLLEMSKIGMFKFAAGLAVLSVGLIAFAGVSTSIGAAAPLLIVGAIAMSMLGRALAPLIESVKSFNGVDWKSTAIGMAGLVAVAGVAAGVGVFSPMILMGSVAILAMGSAVSVFSPAMKSLTDINWDTVSAAGKSLISFAKTTGILGLFSPAIIIGSLAISTMGAAVGIFSVSMKSFSEIKWESISGGVESLISLAKTAGVIGLFSPAIIAGSIAISILGMSLIPLSLAVSSLSGVDKILTGLVTSIKSFAGIDVGTLAMGVLSLTAFSAMAAGIGIMSPMMVAGSVAIAALGYSIGVFAPSLSEFSKVNWKDVLVGVTALEGFSFVAAGLGLISPAILAGSLAVTVLGYALGVFAPSIKAFAGVDWKAVTVGGLALIGFSSVAAGLGMLSPAILMGSMAIAVLGYSLGVFAPSIVAFSNISWKDVVVGGLALIGFSNVAAGLGLLSPAIVSGSIAMVALGTAMGIFSSGVSTFSSVDWTKVSGGTESLVSVAKTVGVIGIFSPAIVAGSIALSTLGYALIPFALGANLAGQAAIILGSGISACIKPVVDLASVDVNSLMGTSVGISMVSAALATFGQGAAVSGIGSLVGKLAGGDPVDKLRELASLGNDLTKTATAIGSITTAFAGFDTVVKFSDAISLLSDSIDKLNKSVSSISLLSVAKLSMATKLQSQMPVVVPPSEPVSTPEPVRDTNKVETNNVDVVKKLDELIQLLRDGAIGVNMDGHSVTKMVAARTA